MVSLFLIYFIYLTDFLKYALCILKAVKLQYTNYVSKLLTKC